MKQANVTDFLIDGKSPDLVALHLTGGECTYGALADGALRVASFLICTGVKPGDRVILIDDSSFFWVIAYLGIMRAGLVCVPLPPSISPRDLEYVRASTGAACACVQSGLARKYANSLQDLRLISERDIPVRASSPAAALPEIKPEDLAALMFTSGSTGRPRGVMVSHGNIIANTESIIEYLALTERDRIMAVLPFYYCFGTSLLHTHLRVGGSIVVESGFRYLDAMLERMAYTECTGFAGVPSHFQMLLRTSSLKRRVFPKLRYIQQAGGHLAPAFIQELRTALPATEVFIMYGQTEATARLSYLPPEMLDRKLGSIGKGIPGVTLRVLNEGGEQIRPGEPGEIVAEGGNVAQGYWCSPEESAVSFRNGRLYTGDMATVDEDGYIYILNRAKEFLKCGGKRVSCREVEDQILGFEGITEAAVIAIPDDVLGEAVKAFVVSTGRNGNGLENELRLFCKEHLAPEVVPKQIVVLRSLPKNSSGKVLRQELKRL